MIVHTAPQGSEEWLAARRGVITGSKAKDARDYKAPTAAQKKEGITRGEPSAKLIGYCRHLARELNGGMAEAPFVSWQMEVGSEQEPHARRAHEARTGDLVLEAGFLTTDDKRFGVSVDGFIDDDGIAEYKAMVSSNTLFEAFAEPDDLTAAAEYIDQCDMAMWLTGRKYVKLCLWAPDLQALRIIHLARNDDRIELLERDLLQFKAMVDSATKKLAAALAIAKESK